MIFFEGLVFARLPAAPRDAMAARPATVEVWSCPSPVAIPAASVFACVVPIIGVTEGNSCHSRVVHQSALHLTVLSRRKMSSLCLSPSPWSTALRVCRPAFVRMRPTLHLRRVRVARPSWPGSGQALVGGTGLLSKRGAFPFWHLLSAYSLCCHASPRRRFILRCRCRLTAVSDLPAAGFWRERFAEHGLFKWCDQVSELYTPRPLLT